MSSTKLVMLRSMLPVQISVVVRMFHYSPRTALAVGLSMAQIGEFAFVLLSVASQLGLLPYQVYMLLMGTPASHTCLPAELIGAIATTAWALHSILLPLHIRCNCLDQ